MPTHLDPVQRGNHTCEYINHPLGWTNELLDGFRSSRCRDEAEYQTRETPVRYLCGKHAARHMAPFRRANDQLLVHTALG